jgi:hypothetical protein
VATTEDLVRQQKEALEMRKSRGIVPLDDCWIEQWWDIAVPGNDETEFCKAIAITVGVGANDLCRCFA